MNRRKNIIKSLNALIVALCLFVPVSGRTAEPAQYLESWTGVDTAGWYDDSTLVSMSNPGGYLNMGFSLQYSPISEENITMCNVGSGFLPTNITFRFNALNVKPSALRVCFHSAESGNMWFVNLGKPEIAVWTEYIVPFDIDAVQWVKGPNSKERTFLKDLQSVNWIGIYVRRNGDIAAQNYAIDNVNITGITMPNPVLIMGKVSNASEQPVAPIVVTATPVSGAGDQGLTTIADAEGNYTFSGARLLTGYDIEAHLDSNTNGIIDFWEAQGQYPLNPVPIVFDGLSGIDFAVIDPVDSDGVPLYWLKDKLGITSQSALHSTVHVDTDGDGMTDFQEWKAGTNPQDRDSKFMVYSDSPAGDEASSGGKIVVTWKSLPNRTYTVKRADDLSVGFYPIMSGITGAPPVNSFVDTTATGKGPYFYKIVVE